MKAETIAKALGGRKAGSAWMARCPAHDDREPSLSIRDADGHKVLVRCHAGCDQGRVITALRSRGLWEENGHRQFARCAARMVANNQSDRDEANRSEAALAIWEAATPAAGTPVASYLVSRGPHIPPPPTLRFHAGLKHPSGGNWPAIVALVTRGADDVPIAIHRSFLARDGSGKAPVDPQRMMLGPCRGGAVRLTPVADVLDGGRGHRDLLRRIAGDRTPRLGGTLDVRAAHARSSGTNWTAAVVLPAPGLPSSRNICPRERPPDKTSSKPEIPVLALALVTTAFRSLPTLH
jgi:hypothetical protein